MNFFVSIIFIALSIFWFLLLTGVVCFSYDKHSFNINLVVILFCFIISCYNLNIININNIVTWKFLFASFILLGFVTFILWFKDIIIEATFQGYHTKVAVIGLRIGFLLFIVSEILFFFVFFELFFIVVYLLLLK